MRIAGMTVTDGTASIVVLESERPMETDAEGKQWAWKVESARTKLLDDLDLDPPLDCSVILDASAWHDHAVAQRLLAAGWNVCPPEFGSNMVAQNPSDKEMADIAGSMCVEGMRAAVSTAALARAFMFACWGTTKNAARLVGAPCRAQDEGAFNTCAGKVTGHVEPHRSAAGIEWPARNRQSLAAMGAPGCGVASSAGVACERHVNGCHAGIADDGCMATWAIDADPFPPVEAPRVATAPLWAHSAEIDHSRAMAAGSGARPSPYRARLSSVPPGDAAVEILGGLLTAAGVHPLRDFYARRKANDELDVHVIPVSAEWEAIAREVFERADDERGDLADATRRAMDAGQVRMVDTMPMTTSGTAPDPWALLAEARAEFATVLAERDAAVSIGTQLERERDAAIRHAKTSDAMMRQAREQAADRSQRIDEVTARASRAEEESDAAEKLLERFLARSEACFCPPECGCPEADTRRYLDERKKATP